MNSEIIWQPSPEYIEDSNVIRLMQKAGVESYEYLHAWSIKDLKVFWDMVVQDLDIRFFKPYLQTLDQSGGLAWTKWFVGGTTNIVLNCIDKNLPAKADKVALYWDGEDGASRSLTYAELNKQVCQFANFLKKRRVKQGDAVGIYMPMVPEVVVAMFACFKIGAVVVPVFSAFGPEALSVRLNDANAKVLVTADGGFRRGKIFDIKSSADLALQSSPSVHTLVMYQHTQQEVPWQQGRDFYWHDALDLQNHDCKTEELPSEAASLVLYTSGTTGKPKGCVHTHAGCLATIGKELAYAFDVKENSRFFWYTDIGWMMGPWEFIGVLMQGGSFLLVEGAPDYPDPSRIWQLVEKYQLDTLGISPTAVRLLKKTGDAWLSKANLSSLKFLASTGEPWDPETYTWFFEKVGKGKCPIINISGGTEIIGCLLSPLPLTELKVCSLRGPGLGVDLDIFDEEGKSMQGGIGHLVVKQPLPSMTKGFLHDRERYLETYFSKFPHVWYHGDWAKKDEDGFWSLHGRSDDTIKVAGKRTGPAEIEAALLHDVRVAEAAAIGVPHEVKGESVVCFVVMKTGRVQENESLRQELSEQVVKALGKTLKPEKVFFVDALPKTRSAKIVRGAIRKKYLGEEIKDLSSIENTKTLDEITQAR